jgi:hypothetical protein
VPGRVEDQDAAAEVGRRACRDRRELVGAVEPPRGARGESSMADGQQEEPMNDDRQQHELGPRAQPLTLFANECLAVVVNALCGIYLLKDPEPKSRAARLALAGCVIATIGAITLGRLK